MTGKRWHRTSLAACAGLLGALGDILLFYVPGLSRDPFLVRLLPEWRIISGIFLTVLMLPLFTLGYWELAQFFRERNPRLADMIFAGSVFGSGVGTAIHVCMGLLVLQIQQNQLTNPIQLSAYAPLVIGLYIIVFLLFGVGSVCLAVPIWKKKTSLPRGFVILLPLWLNLLVFPFGAIFPALAEIFIPSIANISHFLLFAGLAIHINQVFIERK